MSKRSELVLPPGTYAYSLDRANAQLSVLVGPVQNKLEELEGAVIFDQGKGRVVGCPVDRAVQAIHVVPDGSFAIVTNPYVVDGKLAQPPVRKKTLVDDIELQYGRSLNVAGPCSIVPWPGQRVHVLAGYRLQSNQYLVCEVMQQLDEQEHRLLASFDPHGYDADDFTPQTQYIIANTPCFIPPTGTRVTKGGVWSAAELSPLSWARLKHQNGRIRYAYGSETSLVFPRPYETIEETGEAIDLRRTGVLIRHLYQPEGSPYRAGTLEFRTLFGKEPTSEESIYHWPHESEEIVETIEPVEIREGDGVFLQDVATGEISLDTSAGIHMFDPREQRLIQHPRTGTSRARAVIASENEAIEITSTFGSRYIVGPQTTLLDWDEKENLRIKCRQELLIELFGVTADSLPIEMHLHVTVTLRGMADEWFTTEARTLLNQTLASRFNAAVSNLPSYRIVDTPQTLLADLWELDEQGRLQETATIRHIELSLPKIVLLKFGDDAIDTELHEVRREATRKRLAQTRTQLNQQLEEKKAEYESAIEDLRCRADQKKIEIDLAIDAAKAERDKARIEYERVAQEMLDFVADAERRRQGLADEQTLTQDMKRLELQKERLAAQSDANVRVLEAIQPELVAAIKAAGAQTTFSKVAPHLGPAAMLNGIGLHDAIKRLIGNDAAANLLLTDVAGDDKPNGSQKKQSTGTAEHR